MAHAPDISQFDPQTRGLARLLRAESVDELRADLLKPWPGLAGGAPERIAILGAGPEGLRLAQTCERLGIDIAGVYDGNARKRGNKFAGQTVFPAEALTRLPKDMPIVVASHRVLGAAESLRALGHTAVPLALLQVACPDRFAPHDFYDGLIEDLFEHRERYRMLFAALADDMSRATLNAIIAYRLSLDPLRLRDVIDWDLYRAVSFGEDEVYVDGGTYDGDSIQIFIEHVRGRYGRIYGFEPDRETFKALHRRFGNDPRIELHNAGLYSSRGSIGFSADASRAAKVDPDSAECIDVVTLDEVVSGPVSFIKMNIEGAEIDALNGGRELIRRHAPKLAISGYHRPSDLWRLPELIAELNGRYRLYLRQHDGGVIESVIYAIPA